eukprot:CAMPEP_0194565824 /NCGR_PEP_ID=MMETSP0292-20121207/4950_1 /TAXON_ID=39354 /ORGANISM="Heterosigma akashiwo, Strain CCMP2393" /LENGTH=390 /DNA_ID=CAMNT_0039415281 /DNA_START=122 /DNA_END=1291 /DNA_ORIENTATION=+
MEVVEEGSEEGTMYSRDDQRRFAPDGDAHIDFFNEGEEVIEGPEPGEFTTENPESQGTTVAARFPQINTPLRVDPPAQIKAPPRLEPKTKEEVIRETAFSPQAFIKRQQEIMPLIQAENPHTLPELDPRLRALAAAQLRDLGALAASSRRAARPQTEALAHYSRGVLFDNLGMLRKAVEAYEAFLEVARALRDPVLEALAYNCLGVDCMLLAFGESEPVYDGTLELGPKGAAAMEAAARHHTAHLYAADEAGGCVAHTNLGLCRSALGDPAEAARHHQEALLRTQSLGAQGLAVGNLGLLALRQGDASTARACLEQHLQLVQGLQDPQAEVNAWTHLGELALQGPDGVPAAEGGADPAEAARCYEQAARLCEREGLRATLRRLNCLVGRA